MNNVWIINKDESNYKCEGLKWRCKCELFHKSTEKEKNRMGVKKVIGVCYTCNCCPSIIDITPKKNLKKPI